MTKQEFFEKELYCTPHEVGQSVPFGINTNKQVTEEWLICFVKNLVRELRELKAQRQFYFTDD